MDCNLVITDFTTNIHIEVDTYNIQLSESGISQSEYFFSISILLPIISWCHFYNVCVISFIFFIHSFFEGYLGYFHYLAIMYRAAVNLVEQVFLRLDEAFFEYMSKSATTGSWGRWIFIFLRSCNTDFYFGCVTLHFQQQEESVLNIFAILASMSCHFVCSTQPFWYIDDEISN